MKLSKYFTLAEMTASQTATRRGISNVPDAAAIANLKALCENVLDKVREHYGVPITPNSGYRSPALNAAVGGSRNSQHCIGEAVDFTVPGRSIPEVCEWIRKNLEFDQLIQEFYNPRTGSGWIHVSFRRGRNRKQFLRIG